MCLIIQNIDKTGPANSKIAIIMVYDIFGFAPQTIQVGCGLTYISLSLLALDLMRYS